MRTYYRGHDALVTDQHFVWRGSPAKSFVIRELTDVGVVRGDPAPFLLTAAHLGTAALVLVAGGATLVGTSAGAPAALPMAVLLVGAVIGLTLVAAHRCRPRERQLRAMYRRQPVLLYACADATRFNQVSRALLRAIEDAQPPTTWYELAGG